MAVRWISDRCLRCGLCVGVCPQNALSLVGGRIVVDEEKCNECGTCVKACPVRALFIPGGEK